MVEWRPQRNISQTYQADTKDKCVVIKRYWKALRATCREYKQRKVKQSDWENEIGFVLTMSVKYRVQNFMLDSTFLPINSLPLNLCILHRKTIPSLTNVRRNSTPTLSTCHDLQNAAPRVVLTGSLWHIDGFPRFCVATLRTDEGILTHKKDTPLYWIPYRWYILKFCI